MPRQGGSWVGPGRSSGEAGGADGATPSRGRPPPTPPGRAQAFVPTHRCSSAARWRCLPWGASWESGRCRVEVARPGRQRENKSRVEVREALLQGA